MTDNVISGYLGYYSGLDKLFASASVSEISRDECLGRLVLELND